MNFGNKLLLVFAAFAGLLSYMAYRCFAVPIDLVSTEYYKDEISYQDVIDGTKNANALSGKTVVATNGKDVSVQLPFEMKRHQVKGTIFFYSPSHIENDRHFKLTTDNDAKQLIDVKNLKKGNYTVKIDWKENNNHYYAENQLTINN